MIPSKYSWLEKVGALPKVIEEGFKLYGLKEAPGAVNNTTILAWASEIGVSKMYTADKIPWCGLFAGVVCRRADKVIPATPLWALSWGKFGQEGGQPELGDVVVFVRPGGGHVGFYIAEDAESYHVLGGNQSDSVSIARLPKSRLYAVREPIWKVRKPASARPYVVATGGALSTNEA